MFHIGQLVVAIKESPYDGFDTYPVKGHVYRIRGFDECPICYTVGLVLEEILNKKVPRICAMCETAMWEAEQAFGLEYFKPIDNVKQFEKLVVIKPLEKDKTNA